VPGSPAVPGRRLLRGLVGLLCVTALKPAVVWGVAGGAPASPGCGHPGTGSCEPNLRQDKAEGSGSEAAASACPMGSNGAAEALPSWWEHTPVTRHASAVASTHSPPHTRMSHRLVLDHAPPAPPLQARPLSKVQQVHVGCGVRLHSWSLPACPPQTPKYTASSSLVSSPMT
jgi:hypothetical protein